jgi:hypothetical protein
MGALGGRLGALRDVRDAGLQPFVARNIFHDAPSREEAAGFVAQRLERIRASLAGLPLDALLAGRVPAS